MCCNLPAIFTFPCEASPLGDSWLTDFHSKASLPEIYPPPLATCFLPQMSRFSFHQDIMSCIKLKTAKYHLIYSNFLFSEVIPPNLSLATPTFRSYQSPRRSNHGSHQPQHKSTRSPKSSLALTVSSNPGGFFHQHAFSATGNGSEENAHFPFKRTGDTTNLFPESNMGSVEGFFSHVGICYWDLGSLKGLHFQDTQHKKLLADPSCPTGTFALGWTALP